MKLERELINCLQYMESSNKYVVGEPFTQATE